MSAYIGPAAAFKTFITDRQQHTFRAAPQTELVTSACMLLSGFLCLDVLHAPIHLWFYVSALKAVFLSSFSGITTSILQESAACAFITRDQRLGPSRRLSAQTRHRTHRTRATQQPYSAQPEVVRGFRLRTYWSHYPAPPPGASTAAALLFSTYGI